MTFLFAFLALFVLACFGSQKRSSYRDDYDRDYYVETDDHVGGGDCDCDCD